MDKVVAWTARRAKRPFKKTRQLFCGRVSGAEANTDGPKNRFGGGEKRETVAHECSVSVVVRCKAGEESSRFVASFEFRMCVDYCDYDTLVVIVIC